MTAQVPKGAASAVSVEASIDQLLAQNKEQLKKVVDAQNAGTGVTPVGKEWWRADEAMTVSAAVLGFGLLVMVLMTFVLRRSGIHPDAVLRLFGTTTVIIGALFLIVAGYTETQMGPVMGLLGTISGYLLGKNVAAQGAREGVAKVDEA